MNMPVICIFVQPANHSMLSSMSSLKILSRSVSMAKKIEDKCNEMEKEGYVLISTTITLGAKAILIFKK